MKLGFGEILIIFVVILFIVGPDKIPSFAKKIGEGLKAFKNATSDVTKELKENVVDPLNEASAPLREAMEPLTEMKNEINKSVSDIKKDVSGLANPLQAPKAEKKEASEAPVEEKPAEPEKEAPGEAQQTEPVEEAPAEAAAAQEAPTEARTEQT